MTNEVFTNVRLTREAYTELVRVKGSLIEREGRGMTLSDAVLELVRVYKEQATKVPAISRSRG